MKTVLKSAPLAQLDRASGYEPEGREFESLRARHLSFPSFTYTTFSFPVLRRPSECHKSVIRFSPDTPAGWLFPYFSEPARPSPADTVAWSRDSNGAWHVESPC